MHLLWWTIPSASRNFLRMFLKYSFPLSVWNVWIGMWNWVLTIDKKFLKVCLASDLFLRRYTQHNLGRSSMKVMNPLVLERFWTLEGPHISLWITEKGFDVLYDCDGYETQWCFASWRISQWNKAESIFLNNDGNKFFKWGKLGWPSLKCHYIMLLS